RWGRISVWPPLRGSGSLCAPARGLLVETLRTTVRIVRCGVLRDGAAPRKSALFHLRRLDWPAQFKAYDHLGDFRSCPARLPEAAEMAFRGLWLLRCTFLCVSL